MRYFVLYATPEHLCGKKIGIQFNLVETTPEASAIKRYKALASKSDDLGAHFYNQDTVDYLPRLPELNLFNGSDNFVDTRLIFRDIASTSMLLTEDNAEDRFPRFVDSVRGILGNKDERICLFLNSHDRSFKVSSVSWWSGLPTTRIRAIDENNQIFGVMLYLHRKNEITHNVHVCSTSVEPPSKKKAMSYIELVVGTKKDNAIPYAIYLLDQHIKNSESIDLNNAIIFTNFHLYKKGYLLIKNYLRRLQYELFEV